MKDKIVLVISLVIMLFISTLKLKADEVDYYEFLTDKQGETNDQTELKTSSSSVTAGYKATSLLNGLDNISVLNCITLNYIFSLNDDVEDSRDVHLALATELNHCLSLDASLNVFSGAMLIGIDIDGYISNNIKVLPFVLTGGSYHTVLSEDYFYDDVVTYIVATGVRFLLEYNIAIALQFNVEYDFFSTKMIYSGSLTAGLWF